MTPLDPSRAPKSPTVGSSVEAARAWVEKEVEDWVAVDTPGTRRSAKAILLWWMCGCKFRESHGGRSSIAIIPGMTADPRFTETPYQPEGPQPLVREIAPGAAYPVRALGPLAPAVEAVQGMTQAPVAIPAQSALAVASLAVQGFADVEALGGPRPLSLYALTVARSGERKSACDAPLMSGLRDHEREQSRAQRDAFRGWQNAHALWKGERDRILIEARRGKGETHSGAS